MKAAPLVIALLAPVLSAACDTPLFADEDDVFLRTDQSTYSAGDTASLRLINESGQTIGYNLCVHLVQRREGDRWTDTLYGHESLCPLPRFTLRHDDYDTHPAPLDPETPAGTYRFRTRVDIEEDGGFNVYSRSFVVE